jgi:hypothetical protein
MIVGSCFEGDVDMALCGIQHDLYFASSARPQVTIDGGCTLGWIWQQAVDQAVRRRHAVPWINRYMDRIRAIKGFSHKLLQIPHGHIAAYHRWTMPRIARDCVHLHVGGVYPDGLLDSWRDFLRSEIPDLLSADDALIALTRSMIYRRFEAGDSSYHHFQDILMRRYGRECVAKNWWAEEVAVRAGVTKRPIRDGRLIRASILEKAIYETE